MTFTDVQSLLSADRKPTDDAGKWLPDPHAFELIHIAAGAGEYSAAQWDSWRLPAMVRLVFGQFQNPFPRPRWNAMKGQIIPELDNDRVDQNRSGFPAGWLLNHVGPSYQAQHQSEFGYTRELRWATFTELPIAVRAAHDPRYAGNSKKVLSVTRSRLSEQLTTRFCGKHWRNDRVIYAGFTGQYGSNDEDEENHYAARVWDWMRPANPDHVAISPQVVEKMAAVLTQDQVAILRARYTGEMRDFYPRVMALCDCSYDAARQRFSLIRRGLKKHGFDLWAIEAYRANNLQSNWRDGDYLPPVGSWQSYVNDPWLKPELVKDPSLIV